MFTCHHTPPWHNRVSSALIITILPHNAATHPFRLCSYYPSHDKKKYTILFVGEGQVKAFHLRLGAERFQTEKHRVAR
jgi:hypothetical protein